MAHSSKDHTLFGIIGANKRSCCCLPLKTGVTIWMGVTLVGGMQQLYKGNKGFQNRNDPFFPSSAEVYVPQLMNGIVALFAASFVLWVINSKNEKGLKLVVFVQSLFVLQSLVTMAYHFTWLSGIPAAVSWDYEPYRWVAEHWLGFSHKSSSKGGVMILLVFNAIDVCITIYLASAVNSLKAILMAGGTGDERKTVDEIADESRQPIMAVAHDHVEQGVVYNAAA